MTGRARALLGGVLAAGVVLLGVGIALLAGRGTAVAGEPRLALGAPVVDVGQVPLGRSAAPGGGRGDPVAAGARLRVPRLGVDAPVVHVAVRAAGGQRVMQVPRDPGTVGWWSGSARPGAASGTVVVVGHVNYDGVPGALGVLPRARPGDRVALASRTGRETYRVTAVRTYAKTVGIPPDAFRTGGAPRLVLITCGGPFDPATGNYEDNVVAYAVPVTGPS
ncbi:class F sortase [Jatrophihabitans fulvus]